MEGQPTEHAYSGRVESLALELGRALARLDELAAAPHVLDDDRVVVLENTRFALGETKNDVGYARELAEGRDLYVNDAFGSAHRAHSSTEGVAHHVSAAVSGLLMEKELDYLGHALEKPKRPFIAMIKPLKTMQVVKIPLNRSVFAVDFKRVQGFVPTRIPSRFKETQ